MSTSATRAVPRAAYFCMEYGLDAGFSIYSGGLGVLAGDTMKSVGDLKLPVVGIGLLWAQGYTTQRINASGHPEEGEIQDTARDGLRPVDHPPIEVTIAGKTVPLCAYRVDRFTSATLYLLEPVNDDDRWITRRLYGGTGDDRVAQEIVLGVGGVRLLRALGEDIDVYHFNEGHAVFAGLELVREQKAAGATFDDAVAAVRQHIVFTTHTPVKAGNETHDIGLILKMGAGVGLDHGELDSLGGSPFSMTVAGLRLSRRANAVAELHGDTARRMWAHVDGAAPIIAITNGVHAPTWQDARIRAATVPDKPAAQRALALWAAHQTMKGELCDHIAARTGARLDPEKLLIGFARRATAYKRADLIFGDDQQIEAMLGSGHLQLVFAGKAHPKDAAGNSLVARLVEASRRWPKSVVFLENYDMTLGALLTRGADVWLNNPRRPMEASGTSGMKAAMNGCLNASILDGWWPEGCEHGVTGWQIGDASGDALSGDIATQDARDREALYRVIESEIIPRYYEDRAAWIRMMEASIRMASWRFSSDRMVEDYFDLLYAP
ncbi:MAG TPA: alpha-glucan family phosphorylase [Kofleriaceae bacterium]|nr:alpha-glucan family phosphorylase [Kofleriaceae bacterium]